MPVKFLYTAKSERAAPVLSFVKYRIYDFSHLEKHKINGNNNAKRMESGEDPLCTQLVIYLYINLRLVFCDMRSVGIRIVVLFHFFFRVTFRLYHFIDNRFLCAESLDIRNSHEN